MIGCSSNNDNNIISLVENRLLQIAMHYQSLLSAYFAVAYIHLVNMCITFVLGEGGSRYVTKLIQSPMYEKWRF